ncbi:MAG: hypothetical protein A3A44_00025 [Candidatus Sungbacteria bacterium RIFCSPLOWO2_01_FULL_60_25]|uniref:Beta-glucosidase n=1 Tax=Candidatus Sungbacteria bacterium RIFCSPLOWO2_01_FULL_60_25 TaxID=1802281 RepID=A0A1G2LBJ8_9BACT|nr:MAG: hypothetical protein A3A44_00025 [Candidatus Sungbacteria bacterium RIFCSPLOWO2_01_FULL_60_25]
MKFVFPKGFLWGAATSSHQVEGGNRNDWSEWERQNAARLATEAPSKFSHLKNWPDIRAAAEDPANYISGRACDHYHRFREDFDIAKQLRHNAHRFSIEWSRVEPEEGKFDEGAIEHYREVVRALHERGMEPFVTLWHWTLPLWLSKRGGILAPDFPERFVGYAKRMATALGGDARFWMTLNEPTSVIANGYHRGVWPPQERSFGKVRRAYRALAEAHRQGYQVLHETVSGVEVGFGNILLALEPASASPLDHFVVRFWEYWANERFLKLVGDTSDYYALQYYFHFRVAFPKRIRNLNERVSDLGWELYPEGLYHLIKRFQKSGKPIYITESGLADATDRQRAWFIQKSIEAVARARKEDADVRGYFHWSLLDNFEWDKGFWPRFGLVEVNYQTLERKIRPSAREYQKIIEANAVEW